MIGIHTHNAERVKSFWSNIFYRRQKHGAAKYFFLQRKHLGTPSGKLDCELGQLYAQQVQMSLFVWKLNLAWLLFLKVFKIRTIPCLFYPCFSLFQASSHPLSWRWEVVKTFKPLMDFPNSRLTNCSPDFQFQTWEASLMLQKHETDNTLHKTPKLHTWWSVDLDSNTVDTDRRFNHRGCHPEQKRTSSLALRVVHCAQETMLCMYCL